MARHRYGGDLTAWTFTRVDGVDGNDNMVQVVGDVDVTFHNLETGGSQYADLLDEGGSPITHVTTSDGADGREIGTIPPFQGPDGVTTMWAEAAGAPRLRIVAWDAGDTADSALSTASTNASDLNSHTSGSNPHGVSVAQLVDVNLAALAEGRVLSWDTATARWVPIDIAGVTGVVQLAGDQTITGHKTFQPGSPGQRAISLQAGSGQTADLLRALNAAAVEALRVDPQGNVRLNAAVGQIGAIIRARPGQTQHLLRFLDLSDQIIAWVEPDGRIRGPNQGYVLPYSIPGVLTAVTGRHRIYNDSGASLTIRAVRASVGVAPAGQPIIVDVLRSGSTIFTTTENRPTVPVGANTSGRVTNMDVTTLADGDYLTVTVAQVGTTTAGEDLTVQILAH